MNNDLINELSKKFREMVDGNFEQLDRKELIKVVSEICSDTSFLLCLNDIDLLELVKEDMENKEFKIIRIDCDNKKVYKTSIKHSIEAIKQELGTDNVDIIYLPTGDVFYIDTKHPSSKNDAFKADFYGNSLIANNNRKDVEFDLEDAKDLVPKSYLQNC